MKKKLDSGKDSKNSKPRA